MATFRKYAEQLDEIARDARAQILSAEEELKQAEKIRTSYPQNGGTTPEYLAKAARRG